jgi:hypothetical protein
MKKYYEYFIFYRYDSNEVAGFGNCSTLVEYKISSMDMIRNIEHKIMIDNKFTRVAIVNWRLLDE